MKKQWSDGIWMAIGITTGVVSGGILWIIFDKPSIWGPWISLGLVLGIFLENRFGQSKKFGADKTSHSRVMDRAFHCLK
jgi:uncharacterized membrane protein YoaK (UPF0700 family)